VNRADVPSLEAEPRLKLDDPAGEAVGRAAEATGILDVRRRRYGNQWCEVQNVEGIEEISSDCKLGSFDPSLKNAA
jgi:hypothetical protein